MHASVKKHILNFSFEAGTSKGVLNTRPTWYLILEENNITGIGECAPLKGFSIDWREDYEQKLDSVCIELAEFQLEELLQLDLQNKFSLSEFPSILFGLESAILDLKNGGKKIIFDNSFIKGTEIPINGLIWMGNPEFLREQIKTKIDSGFNCLKMKIGVDFEMECGILSEIRSHFASSELILRVDANGAFKHSPETFLHTLEKFDLHSIEQPIAPGNILEMKNLCKNSPVKIALDEELFSYHQIYSLDLKRKLLESVNPDFIVLKPTMLGGFKHTREWIQLAEELKIGWWITSFLESNIGLNAICQFTAGYSVTTHQGLGTGQLYTNNIDSPLQVRNGKIGYSQASWKDMFS